MNRSPLIALFPLKLVLFPGIMLPLHIFEERYKQMIRHCIDHSMEFGIVLHDGSALMSAGCTASLISVLHEYEDGRMDILTRGERRFQLGLVSEERAWLEGAVNFFDDKDPSAEIPSAQLQEAHNLLKELLKQHGENVDDADLQELPPAELSFLLASRDGFTLSEKQRLLQMTSVSERLNQEIQLAEALGKRAADDLLLKQAIKSNGKLPH